MTAKPNSGNEKAPSRSQDAKVAASDRRALLAALAGAPIILTLMSKQARAEYDAGIYFEGSLPLCNPPGSGQDPSPPPPGCKQGQQ